MFFFYFFLYNLLFINRFIYTLNFFQQYNKESNQPKWAKNLQKNLLCIASGVSQLTQKFDSNKNRDANNNITHIISKFYAKLENI